MTKRLDPDIKALGACVRALDKSSSLRMLCANTEFLWDRYIVHPRDAVEQFTKRATEERGERA
jgi:hypothetical protein